ncbi:hypothetical protein BDW02DRAFT_283665 [Decorospora gaudefroyi]|uniref:Uncharacterized protein n=1 Tax=Decorospora gaudefroyi TaxID=184978 RepID=A0A6A5KJ12_9PLEO|nr:hypothetical protein BDW02DRAFT_283665 [Decorospora gaudefroyi]
MRSRVVHRIPHHHNPIQHKVTQHCACIQSVKKPPHPPTHVRTQIITPHKRPGPENQSAPPPPPLPLHPTPRPPIPTNKTQAPNPTTTVPHHYHHHDLGITIDRRLPCIPTPSPNPATYYPTLPHHSHPYLIYL